MIDKPHNQKVERPAPHRDRPFFEQRSGDGRAALLRLQREVNSLKRALAEREHEVWTLKQLLLYR